ncbi:hypothetical protein D3C72_2544670 [compost metagenome]
MLTNAIRDLGGIDVAIEVDQVTGQQQGRVRLLAGTDLVEEFLERIEAVAHA